MIRHRVIPPWNHRNAPHASRVLPWCAVAFVILASGCTPSPHDTIARGDLDALGAMLEARPDRVAERNRLGKEPLQYAVMYRDLEAMEALVGAGANVNAADDTGLTALHVAAMHGWRAGMRWLLEHGADLEQRDVFGDRPSHTAAIHGQGGALSVLHEAGDPLTAKNEDGRTPLDLAQKHRKARAVEHIEKLLGKT